jgi:hypothetical protein
MELDDLILPIPAETFDIAHLFPCWGPHGIHLPAACMDTHMLPAFAIASNKDKRPTGLWALKNEAAIVTGSRCRPKDWMVNQP